MKARLYIAVNEDEIESARTLNMPLPASNQVLVDFTFRIDHITAIWPHSKDRMIVYILGDPFGLKYDDKIYRKITGYLDDTHTQTQEA